jgi:hypothetical protein
MDGLDALLCGMQHPEYGVAPAELRYDGKLSHGAHYAQRVPISPAHFVLDVLAHFVHNHSIASNGSLTSHTSPVRGDAPRSGALEARIETAQSLAPAGRLRYTAPAGAPRKARAHVSSIWQPAPPIQLALQHGHASSREEHAALDAAIFLVKEKAKDTTA